MNKGRITEQNIFLTLSKYYSAKDENYLTEAFVYLINFLLDNERVAACSILNQLCVCNSDFSFDPEENISVITQEVTEQGTPDIRISTPNTLVYIEVKHDSPLGYQQIQRYKKALASSSANIKQVTLLTRFPIDLKGNEEKPYKHSRWYEVYNWLSSAKTVIKDPVSLYLIDSFNSFLEVKQMSIQKVTWEYINGVPAMMNLINMIEVAILGAGLKLYPKSPRVPALESRGFYIETTNLWCGIFYNTHLTVSFQIADTKSYNMKLLKKPSYPVDDDKWGIYFRLPLEEHHFFSLNQAEQVDLITKFVKTAYLEAKRMEIK